MNWFGGVRYFRGLPAGLVVALLAGTAIAWTSTFFDLNYGGLSVAGVTESITHFGFSLPLPAFGHVFSGFSFLGLLLVTAIPFGLYDLIEALDNVESAAVAGDSFPTTRVLCADGVISLIGCLVGCPFMLAVYIGHPGWKEMGGRVGYSFGTGIMVLDPVLARHRAADARARAGRGHPADPAVHRHADRLAGLPGDAVAPCSGHHAGHGAESRRVGAQPGERPMTAAHVTRSPELNDALASQGVLLHGLEVLGGGAALSGIVLGAVTVYVIERQLMAAAAFAAAGAVFTFFGLMHGERIGIASSPVLAAGYLAVAAVFAGCARLADATARSSVEHAVHRPEAPAHPMVAVPSNASPQSG